MTQLTKAWIKSHPETCAAIKDAVGVFALMTMLYVALFIPAL